MCSAAIALRPACPQDFDYCAKLYFAGMAQIIRQLNLDIRRQAASFQKQWEPAQVQVITLQGADVGWLQIAQTGDSLFLSQLFVDTPFQRQGVGTEVMRQLIRDASAAGHAVTLAVAKINPALELYQRLGFKITHEDDLKFYMRREP